MRSTTLRHRLRDFAVVASAVAVLVVGSLAMNDRWRQSLASASEDAGHITSNPTFVALTNAASGVVSVVRDFSVDNTFLFAFLVVAAVLVVLMLRT